MELTKNTPVTEFQALKCDVFENIEPRDVINMYRTLRELRENYHTKQIYHYTKYLANKNFDIDNFFQYELENVKERIKRMNKFNMNRHFNEQKKYHQAILTIDSEIKKIHHVLIDISDTIKEILPETGPVCRICTDNINFLLASQCGHTFCSDCHKNLKKYNKQPLCPTCRVKIKNVIKIFI